MGERLEVDGELEVLVELDDILRRLRIIRDHHARHLSVPKTQGPEMPFCAEFALNAEHEMHTHEVAPPPDGFSLHDEPPSKPA